MAIQRWDPRRDLVELQRRMKEMFDEALSRSAGGEGDAPGGAWKPPLDLFEEAQRYVLRADLPGVTPGDVELQVENGKLTIRGERRIDSGIARESYLRVERPHGPFAAQIQLPASVDAEAIQAIHRDGVIEVILPKRKTSTPSRIEISTG